ncbi:MAG: hypothetical protein HQ536_02860 [Parcubacteria group bacterium]|nr:hypothetical protein [Parcubacteria group bacterium]
MPRGTGKPDSIMEKGVSLQFEDGEIRVFCSYGGEERLWKFVGGDFYPDDCPVRRSQVNSAKMIGWGWLLHGWDEVGTSCP